ncbi:hypothetical protein WGM54_03670 [Paenibacillus polymyxa]|uniref:hypothetical protein n=1 Tax=Paenibacillus polymyxa TaxID=1406 RepID=UPI00307F3500
MKYEDAERMVLDGVSMMLRESERFEREYIQTSGHISEHRKRMEQWQPRLIGRKIGKPPDSQQ